MMGSTWSSVSHFHKIGTSEFMHNGWAFKTRPNSVAKITNAF